MLERSFLTRLRHFAKKIPGMDRLWFNARLVARPSYREDGLCTVHNADFLRERGFAESYAAAKRMQPELKIAWRSHVAQWAGQQAMLLPDGGDFVECGVNRAFLSTSVMHATDFAAKSDRRFWLFDTYCGLDPDSVGDGDKAAHFNEYVDVYDFVCKSFEDMPNVRIVRGIVPESLQSVEIERVAYLSIDMNCAAPELAALEHFWPKLVPGAIVLLDDYGWKGHAAQKRVADDFAAAQGTQVLTLPTGQGVLIKHGAGPRVTTKTEGSPEFAHA